MNALKKAFYSITLKLSTTHRQLSNKNSNSFDLGGKYFFLTNVSDIIAQQKKTKIITYILKDQINSKKSFKYQKY